MYKKIIFSLLGLFISIMCFAQLPEISGIIKDTTANLPVSNAVVALISPGDSILKSFTRTKEDGSYILKNIQPGDYLLMVMHPLFADYVDNISIKNENETLASISVTSKSKVLEAVILKSGSPIRIKGDTTIYTADSFKVSANANVEELLKKLPGIQVDKNGEIKAMGETVQKVLVDGEEFFGDDPGMAVKNLRADAVKEVQVFDKKSEQAEFTGIDDGNTQKTINLKLKEDKKTGYFGKIDLSGGLLKNIDDRYNNNILYSTFKGKRKLSGFFLNGNTGQDGLSWQDNDKYGGESDNYSMSMDDDGGVMYQWRGGSSDEEPYINTENGFIKNTNAGLQYSNKWNDKQTFNFSPRYNSQIYDNLKQTYSLRQLPGDSSLIDSSVTNTHISRYNFKLGGTYDIKLDSNNTVKLTLKSNFYHTESDEQYFLSRTDQDSVLLNSSDKNTKINSDKKSFTANAIFKHKFKKSRRTLSFTADWNLLQTKGLNYLKSLNRDYKELLLLNVDQEFDVDRLTQKLSSKLAYTEPLGKKFSMEIGYELSLTSGNNNQVTHSYNNISAKYDERVDSLTNEFNQKIIIHKPSLKFSYNHKKIKFNLGSGFGITDFDLVDKTFDKTYRRSFTNIFPSGSFIYTYKPNHSFRLNYTGYTVQPTINQLQPLRNNYDQYDQYIGNPDLRPAFTNNISVSHNTYNFIKDLWTYMSLNLRATSNSITNSRRYDGGKVTTQPVNTDGNISVSMWTGLGYKLKKADIRFNVGPNLNYNKFTDFIDGRENISKTLNAGLSFYASKTKEKKYDFSVSNEFNYNVNRNSLNANRYTYPAYTASLEATVYYKKVWSVNSSYQYYYRGKLNTATDPLNNNLLSAKLQRTFKNNEFTIYLKVRDILNQNIGIERTFDANIYIEETNLRLKRYFLLGFTWDFKNKAAAAK